MRRSILLVASASFLAFLAACGETAQPTAVEALLDAESIGPAFSAHPTGRRVVMLDACDPETFNAFFGFEVCTPVHARAGIPFSTFVALLELHQRVDAWRFAPDMIRVTRPTTVVVPNLGGIPHSFTEVEEFGGGFIELLNELSGNPIPAPECLDFENMVLVAPGDHDVVTFQPGQRKKYMCCIHPWMRAETF